MTKDKKRLIIIDSHSLIHRAYYVFKFLTTKKGEKTGAIYGFLLTFLNVVNLFHPDFIAAVFDIPVPTFRHKQYKEYKAKRPPAPEELYQQIPKIKEILRTFNIPVFEKEGFEADDIIGTIAQLASKKQIIPKIETIILTSDLDMFQLVNSQTKVYLLNKGTKNVILYNEELVKERLWGLSPKQFLEFKALRGDPSDNIPGVTGIGEKTAVKLILKFNNIENLYQEIESNSKKAQELKPKLKELLAKHKEQAFLSKMLAEIKKDVLINFNLEKCYWKDYNKGEVIKNLEDLEFYSLIKKLTN
jgi:DNA polymerase-1